MTTPKAASLSLKVRSLCSTSDSQNISDRFKREVSWGCCADLGAPRGKRRGLSRKETRDRQRQLKSLCVTFLLGPGSGHPGHLGSHDSEDSSQF